MLYYKFILYVAGGVPNKAVKKKTKKKQKFILGCSVASPLTIVINPDKDVTTVYSKCTCTWHVYSRCRRVINRGRGVYCILEVKEHLIFLSQDDMHTWYLKLMYCSSRAVL